MVTADLDEPVAAVRHIRSDFRQDVYDHVPGTVLRGALAAAWIQRHGAPSPDDPEFAAIFEGDGSFGPLHHRNGTSLPTPLSVKTHKYRPGERCKQLWWDRATAEDAATCPECHGALDASKGAPVGRVEQHRRTRAALDEQGVAKDGHLFSQNTLPAGMRLTGWVYGPAARAFAHDTETLFLGARRSVGGQARVTIDREAEPDPVELDGSTIVLRLASPGIFVDAFGLPSEVPDIEELSEQLGVPVESIEQRWTRWTESGGWHAASGLPKPTERAVLPGSTYRVRCAEPASEPARRRLMARGIGLRRREGYGALCRPGAPHSIEAITGTLAPLRGWRLLPSELPILRERAKALHRGNQVDSRYAKAMLDDTVRPEIARALRVLLAIRDVDRYMDAISFLERAQ
ncbi:CRISPR-associated protein Csx10 [Haloechinothrix alba]|uniref:CRISPR-associated protein Csx10 n=2 Tax=Haloechinothrix alba TaxID=664784 RepID=A0A238ZWZ0_9PSEU|nr:CRISPR-associated protein Csx10 [Haloechinothrix alba]